jgi:gamma-glutamylcyclotransferase (GGCT)/AIG2-like uncharacterized protein YtfP
MTLYWAYGSNLDPVSMRRRCPSAKRIGPLTLDNGQLIFRGVADVVHYENSSVPGGVWRISKECERVLDQYEGVKYGLYKKRYLKLKIDGVKEQCLYYQMSADRGIMPPAEHYLDVIRRGYEYFGLDLEILNRALEASWSDKKVTPHLRERHNRKGRPALAQRDFLEE